MAKQKENPLSNQHNLQELLLGQQVNWGPDN